MFEKLVSEKTVSVPFQSRGGWKEVRSRADRSISTVNFAESAKFFVSSQQFCQHKEVQVSA